jgi:hypothetical protein
MTTALNTVARTDWIGPNVAANGVKNIDRLEDTWIEKDVEDNAPTMALNVENP